MPARSEVSDGEVLDGEIITMLAALMSGEAATAAPEQEVPMIPTTRSSAAMVWAAAWPPSAEHRSSRPVPMSTSKPWIGPKSVMAISMARCMGRPRKATSPVMALSERTWIASPPDTRTSPSDPSPTDSVSSPPQAAAIKANEAAIPRGARSRPRFLLRVCLCPLRAGAVASAVIIEEPPNRLEWPAIADRARWTRL